MESQRLEDFPLGFELRYSLRGHKRRISQISWSPNGRILASSSEDKTIRLWDTETGHLLRILEHSDLVTSVAWSPDGQTLASGSVDSTIRLWETNTGQLLQILIGHSDTITKVMWSPNRAILASGSFDKTIRLWNTDTGQLLYTFTEHFLSVRSLAWSPDGQTLASGSVDSTIRLWETNTGQLLKSLKGYHLVLSLAWSPNGQALASTAGDNTVWLWDTRTWRQTGILECHTGPVTYICFSSDGRLLASKSQDGTVQIWNCDTWETITILNKPIPSQWDAGLAFNPKTPILATLGETSKVIRIWNLNLNSIFKTTPIIQSIHYANAKVVLLGDSGVGKSGLSLVLTGQSFAPSDSTHGRRVWILDTREVELGNGREETREILLWDLAGQPGYRLVHQLHLNDVSLALVVFDAQSETNPFSGIYYWDRALRQAQSVQGNSAPAMKKILVSARVDRGGKGVSYSRIQKLVGELDYESFFETSAKYGKNIMALREAIKDAIDWDALPKVSSTSLFQHIKIFLIGEKDSKRVLSSIDDLYRTFLKSQNVFINGTEELRSQFETCIGRIESRGLIRRLSFGNFILLQPELLDAYASALINSVKDEPDGWGNIAEEKVLLGDFSNPEDERLDDREQEKLLLISMVEDLLRREIVFREKADDGVYLVFPSQSTRENPDISNLEGKSVCYSFQGPVQNIYATLAVRLSHGALFTKKELWKNAVSFTSKAGGTCGMVLSSSDEGQGELTLFFDKIASEESRFHFEEYIKMHLERHALPESITRRRFFVCDHCGLIITDQLVRLRLDKEFSWLDCPVCGNRFSLLDREERLLATPSKVVKEMDKAADSQRDRDTAQSILQGKIKTADFDVFLCYKSKNKAKIKEIGAKLKERGILPWLDEWELPPGRPWQSLLEQQIGQIKSAAVFVGSDGLGPWQHMEVKAFLDEFVKRHCPVIPVLLPDYPTTREEPELPIFLRGMTWVDLRKDDSDPDYDPIGRLIWGITGKRSLMMFMR